MFKVFITAFAMLFVIACSDDKTASTEKQSAQTKVVRKMDFAQVSRGGRIFQQNCIKCHGDKAQGAANWQKAGADGKFPAPPLNGTGHAWHHPRKVLVNTIKNGTAKLGGSMPAWNDKLTDQDIQDVIAWFQSKWSDEIYSAWYERDQLAKKN